MDYIIYISISDRDTYKKHTLIQIPVSFYCYLYCWSNVKVRSRFMNVLPYENKEDFALFLFCYHIAYCNTTLPEHNISASLLLWYGFNQNAMRMQKHKIFVVEWRWILTLCVGWIGNNFASTNNKLSYKMCNFSKFLTCLF